VVSQTDGAVVPLSGDVLASSSEPLHVALVEMLRPLHQASAERG
jgi:hypothetical protein